MGVIINKIPNLRIILVLAKHKIIIPNYEN